MNYCMCVLRPSLSNGGEKKSLEKELLMMTHPSMSCVLEELHKGNVLITVSFVYSHSLPLSSSLSPGAAGCRAYCLFVDRSSCWPSFCFKLRSGVSPH